MERYEKYKESGIEWMGEIPEHWNLVKLGFFISVVGGSTPKSEVDAYWDGLVNWVTTDDLGKLKNRNIVSTRRKITEAGLENCSASLVPKYSVIISSRAPIGHLGILAIDAATNQGCKALIPTKGSFVPEFLFYFLLSSKTELQNLGTGSTFTEISSQVLKSFKILKPPLKEQTQIARYLDQQTATIDELIERKEKLIELLKEKRQAIINEAVTKGLNPNAKMKDSGIEWLGEVPEGWSNTKMGYCCEFVLDGTHGSFSRVYEGYRLLSVRNIINSQFTFRDDDSLVSKKDYLEISSKFKIQEDDIQLAIVGATLGKVAIVGKLLEEFVTQRSLATLRSDNSKCVSRYLFYFMRSSSFQSYLWLNAGFSAQPGIYLGSIQNCAFSLPKIDEQKGIVAFLDDCISKNEFLVNKVSSQIEKLKEYRQSVISEAVTGKVDVRNWLPDKH